MPGVAECSRTRASRAKHDRNQHPACICTYTACRSFIVAICPRHACRRHEARIPAGKIGWKGVADAAVLLHRPDRPRVIGHARCSLPTKVCESREQTCRAGKFRLAAVAARSADPGSPIPLSDISIFRPHKVSQAPRRSSRCDPDASAESASRATDSAVLILWIFEPGATDGKPSRTGLRRVTVR